MGDKITSYAADIYYAWKLVLACSATAILLGYIYLILIRWLGGLIVWLSIILIQLSLIIGGWYMYDSSEDYDEESDYRDWVKYAAYGIWGLAGLYFLCVCCCFNAIRIGVAVYQTTADYVTSNVRIYLLPFCAYITAGLWVACWLVSFIYVFSVGEPEAREGYPFITEIKWEDDTRYVIFYQLFMLFWMNAFIMGVAQFVIAASACIWYFEVGSDTGAHGCVGRGIKWAFRYHLGSVAFGAALIAICQMIRTLFEYYRRKIQSMAGDSKIVKCLLCYTSYCLWLLEKCIKFITENAYI